MRGSLLSMLVVVLLVSSAAIGSRIGEHSFADAILGVGQLQGDEIRGKLFSGAARESLRTAKDVRVYDCLKVALGVERQTYCFGQPVHIKLAITNTGSRPITLRFSSGQQYDFVVTRADKEVWRWSADKVFIQALTSRTLAPSETLKFREIWQQKDNQGRQVPAGEYSIAGLLTTMKSPRPKAGPISIKIEPGP